MKKDKALSKMAAHYHLDLKTFLCELIKDTKNKAEFMRSKEPLEFWLSLGQEFIINKPGFCMRVLPFCEFTFIGYFKIIKNDREKTTGITTDIVNKVNDFLNKYGFDNYKPDIHYSEILIFV